MSEIFIRDSLKSSTEVKPKIINRKKSKYVNFRMTPEDNDKLNHKILMSGLKKQDYITQALLNNKVVTIGNIKSFTNIKKILNDIYLKLTDNTTSAYIDEVDISDFETVVKMMREHNIYVDINS